VLSRRQQIKNYHVETRIFRRRLLLASIIVAILVGVLLVRLAYLQIFSYGYYRQLANQNQLELFAIEPNRGLIYDRNGVLLAENIPIFTLSIIPDYITDIGNTINGLSTIIEINDVQRRQFYRALKQYKKFAHIPVKYKLTQKEVEVFYANQFRFPGVVIDPQMIRHYPLGEATANIIGYIGKVNAQDAKNLSVSNYTLSSLIGKIGIEKYYEGTLRGHAGYQQVEIDASGHIVRNLKKVVPEPGENLYLTIDSKMQLAAQHALGDESGSVVVIDPNNGEVLALVTNPSYDPNLFAYGIDTETFQKLQNSPDKPMYNRAVRGLFPPASTFKPFVALAFLDNNVADTSYSIYDPGWFKLPNTQQIFRDWQPRGHGSVNISKAITVSCDVFFYTMAVKLGIEKMANMLQRFGFGQKTAIDLGEELMGIVATPKWKRDNTGKDWYPGNTVLSSIGQGYMLTTPLQLAHATAILAARGENYLPHLLLKQQTASGNVVEGAVRTGTAVALKNSRNWDVIINAMKNVTMSPSGTAFPRFGANMPYTVAGKTGTAQLFRHRFNEENATFETANIPKRLRNHSLFIAFAPIDKPKVAIAVIVENSVSAPIVARRVLDYYFVPEKAAADAVATAAERERNKLQPKGKKSDQTQTAEAEAARTEAGQQDGEDIAGQADGEGGWTGAAGAAVTSEGRAAGSTDASSARNL
jgi:penicillin-binding protein 2